MSGRPVFRRWLPAQVRALGAPVVYGAAFVWRRLLVRTTFVAVSGSLGKTTTKECVATVLAAGAPTYRSWRSQNSNEGVVSNVLRVRPWHRYAVLELAAAGPGTMRRKARLVAPDVVVLLPVTATHSQSFRDLDEHAAEKEVLLRALRPGGLGVLAADDVRVAAMAARAAHRIVRVGTSSDADVRADDVSSTWPARLTLRAHRAGESVRIDTQLVGAHWVPAVLSAVATAVHFGVALPDAARAIGTVPPFPGRMQPVRVPNGAVVLRDDYNAPIEGAQRALDVLVNARAGRRVVVFTDFSDFAGNRRRRLRFLAPQIARAADLVVLVGPGAREGAGDLAGAGVPRAAIRSFNAFTGAIEYLRQDLGEDDLVLLKGRTTDHIARLLLAQFGTVRCWKSSCQKRILCDVCGELGLSPQELRHVRTGASPAVEPRA